MLTAPWLLRAVDLSERFCLPQNCVSGSQGNKKVLLNVNESAFELPGPSHASSLTVPLNLSSLLPPIFFFGAPINF